MDQQVQKNIKITLKVGSIRTIHSLKIILLQHYPVISFSILTISSTQTTKKTEK